MGDIKEGDIEMCSDAEEVEVETYSNSFDEEMDRLYRACEGAHDEEIKRRIVALIAGTAGCRS